MIQILAQQLKIPGSTSALQGPLPASKGFTNIASLVNNAMPILFPIAGILVLIYLIWGGFEYMTAMGDPKKAQSGRTRITQAVIGFFIIFTAYWITQLVAFLFGLKDGPISY